MNICLNLMSIMSYNVYVSLYRNCKNPWPLELLIIRPLKQQVNKKKLKYSSVINMLLTVYYFVEIIFCLIIAFNFSLLFIFLYMSQ